MEYNKALEQLVTVAYDKSIVIGARKWNDVVILRSTIHLNMSTCHFKLQKWKLALEEALECLVGNVREQQMYTDPHVLAKIKKTSQKSGTLGVVLVEQRLPRVTRAKAWFRVAQCYTNLKYLDRSKEAIAKALEMCDDRQMMAELANHSMRLEAMKREEKEKQKKQFEGFFSKLSVQGGYVDRKQEDKAGWNTLGYKDKLKALEELDDSSDSNEESSESGTEDSSSEDSSSEQAQILR